MPLGVSASQDFDVKLYMENNPDLVAVYGVDSYVPYYEHYMNQGKIEIYQDDGNYKQINGGGLIKWMRCLPETEKDEVYGKRDAV